MEENIFQEAIGMIVRKQTGEVSWRQANLDNTYQEASNKVDLIWKQLKERLGEEHQDLLDDLESAWNVAEGVKVSYAYRQGIQDGPQIRNELMNLGIQCK